MRIHRNLYAEVGLAQIPHILSMLDRNCLSPTYGCFDRSYWHYKTAAFPSGMYQEFVLPLALIYQYRFPGGDAYYGQPRLRELVVAGIRYAARSAHRDCSCDDYFPYERALGAVAFSLYATTESYLLLDLAEPELLDFFRARARWLMTHHESGQLSNHHALSVVALYNVYRILGDEQFLAGARRRLEMLLGWQNEEGWFPEYEGFDPGYLTATIDFLAKYHKKSNDPRVIEPLKAAMRFASQFIHPDGSYGGEYGSRNTALFFPHGFELMAAFVPETAKVAALYLKGVRQDNRVHLDDDRLCAHLTYNHLQAYLDYWEGVGRDATYTPRLGRQYWRAARIYLHREKGRYAVVSTAKGGVFRLYKGERLACVDSGLIARLGDGTTLVSHLIDDYAVRLLEDGIEVEGCFGEAHFRLPNLMLQAVFNLAMSTVGRWASDTVRALLQRILIVGKRRHPMRFKRTLILNDEVRVVDELWKSTGAGRKNAVVALFAGTDHTSIYVAMSNSYQKACLWPWTDYDRYRETLNREGYVRIERHIG
jgi:hypothetical protein